MNRFEGVEVGIDIKGFNKNPLATVTLTIEDRIEIRFAAIFWKRNREEIFFALPALGRFGFKNCVVFLDKKDYLKLSIFVLNRFKEEAQAKFILDESEVINKLIDERIVLIEDSLENIETEQ